MGDLNQVAYLKRHAQLARGPLLEIGSRDYGNTPDYRQFLPGIEYIGVDLFEGPGVDLVADLSGEMVEVDAQIGGRRFNTILCFSVLEHCSDVFRLCRNLEALLEKNGRIFISAPFVWEYHAFPDDYWRFSPSGIKALFPRLRFNEEETMISTSNIGELKKLNDKEFFKIDLAPRVGAVKKRYSWTTAVLIRALKTFSLMPELLNHIYVMPPVNVNMIGMKENEIS